MNENIKKIIEEIDKLELDEKIKTLNNIKDELKKISPFKENPVDDVKWVKCEEVFANDYNPNF